MPYESHYVDAGKGLHKYGTGIVTGAELYRNAIQCSADTERGRKLKYCLTDFSEVTDMQATPETMRQVVEVNRKLAEITPGGIVATVAPDPLAYGLVRFWQTFAEDLGWKTNVFQSRAAAIWWLRKQLGLDDPASGVTDEDYPSLRLNE